MEIWHRISLDPEKESILQELNIPYERAYNSIVKRTSFITFNIAESHPAWLEIKRLIDPGGTLNLIWTEFTREEILNAAWLIARVAHAIGYPAPNDTRWDARYVEPGCPSCGVGWRQIAPFALKKEPRLGKHVFTGFWGGFELFCTPEVLEGFEAEGIGGYEVWPVLLYKTGESSQQLRQLIVPSVAESALVEALAESERFEKTVCPACGQVWYSYYVRGMLPLRREALRQELDCQLTHEWFGNGRTARRELLVSQRVARLIVERKWKGLELWPVQLV